MAITQVRTWTTGSGSLTTQHTLTGPATIEGSLLLLTIMCRDNASLDPVVTDNSGNTWVKAGTFRDAAQSTVQHLFYALDAASITAVTQTVFGADGVSPPSATHTSTLREFRGVLGLSDVESGASLNAVSGNPLPAPGVTVTEDGSLVISAITGGAASRVLAAPTDWNTVPVVSMASMYHWFAWTTDVEAGTVTPVWGFTSGQNTSFGHIVAAFTPDPDFGGPLTVDVGADLTAFAGQIVPLTATVGGGEGTRNYSWSIQSGPAGEADFSTPTGATTSFDTAGVEGTYVLRCTVTDTSGTAYDELTLTVNPRPRVTITGASGWTNVVGAATALAALTDELPETYISTGPNPTNETLTLDVPPIETPVGEFVLPLELSAEGPGGTVTPQIEAGETWVSGSPIFVSGALSYYEASWPVADLGAVEWNQGFKVRLVASTA